MHLGRTWELECVAEEPGEMARQRWERVGFFQNTRVQFETPIQEAERPILTIAPGDPKSQPPWTPTNMSHTHKDPQIHIIKNKFEKRKRQEADREAGWGASVTLESSPEMPTFSSHLALPEISTTSPDGLSAGFHIGNHDKLTVFVS